jgi:outer membrane murein-binding lipoprotein Lpp
MPASLMNSGALSPALFGVISALVGVVAGGALTAWQQSAQRKHDAAENTKGRIIQLRREVYVVAVEHHTKAMTSLERRPMVSERDFKEAQAKFFASLFKIQMVGSDRSIVAANVLALLYQEVAAEVDSHCADVRATHVAYEAAQARATAANDRLDAIEHELLSLQPDETGVHTTSDCATN